MRSLTIFTTLSFVSDLYNTLRAAPSLSDANAFHILIDFPAGTETFAFQIVDATLSELDRMAHARAVMRKRLPNEQFTNVPRKIGFDRR